MSRIIRLLPILLLLACAGAALHAQQAPAALPSVTIDFGKTPQGPALSSTLQAVLLLTVLTLAPTILLTTTCFTRIIIVLGFVRQGMGTAQTPSNQVLISLALVLSFFVMAPVGREINTTVLQPLNRNELTVDQAMTKAAAPLEGVHAQAHPQAGHLAVPGHRQGPRAPDQGRPRSWRSSCRPSSFPSSRPPSRSAS